MSHRLLDMRVSWVIERLTQRRRVSFSTFVCRRCRIELIVHPAVLGTRFRWTQDDFLRRHRRCPA